VRISPIVLTVKAEATGFRAEMLEKSVPLLALLDAIRDQPVLDGKLALNGGTAPTQLVLDVPRLSVDIDFNYMAVVGGHCSPWRWRLSRNSAHNELVARFIIWRGGTVRAIYGDETLNWPNLRGCAEFTGYTHYPVDGSASSPRRYWRSPRPFLPG